MAEALADAGARVVICSRKVEACRQVKESIEQKGGEALALSCDVTRPEDVERVVAAAKENFGGVDIVINNSGATWGAPPEEMPLDKFERVMDVNVKGTFLMSQAAGKEMIAEERAAGSSTSLLWPVCSGAIPITCRPSGITPAKGR